MKTRTISGLILIAAAAFLLIAGGIPVFLACLGVSLIAAGEFYNAMKVRPADRPFGILDCAGYVCIALYYISAMTLDSRLRFAMLLVSFMVIMAVYVFTFPKYKSRQVMAAFTGVLYTGIMFSFVYLTRSLEGGILHVWLIIIVSAGCDTAAYFTGMFFGKHKLSPVVSPNKTVEGALGGVAASVVLGLLFALIFRQNILVYLLICLIGSVISQIGDLTASAFKRNMNLKDYGGLIPGHGGVLDRIDSVIFAAPVVYYLLVFLL